MFAQHIIMMNGSNLAVAFVVCVLCVLRVVRADCAWQEDRSAGVMCFMNAIERSAIVDLDIAVGTTRLTVDCNQELLFESVVPEQMFAKLGAALEELHIESCKLLQLKNTTFVGLRKLRTLNIHTRNSAWGQANKLELDMGIFDELTEVQVLTATDNNIRSLPTNIFCAMKSLQSLNVSHNRIRSAQDLGLNACGDSLTQLKTIDLSFNQLVTFDADWTGTDLRSLQTLYMHENNLTKIAAGSFDGLVSLRVLNLSANHLETLAAGLFAHNTGLQEIYVQDNKLYQLPVELFASLNELLILDLSGNQLSSHYIDATIFSQLKRLIVLNLANNALTRIDSSTFEQLNFLQILDLKNNSIGFIDDRTFLPLTNLHTLNLAGNRLHIVNNELFNGLYVLNRLVLSNNLVTVVESNAFVNCSSLKELDLSSNQLNDVPVAVTGLRMLKSLDLGENRISLLTNDSFRNLNQLTGLRLMDNLIANVTCGCLYDLPKLNVLNLARNKIQSIQRGSFDRNREIEAIRLDKNLLNDINGVFATLNSLLWLNLSENQLVWFDYAFIPMNLKWLDVHGNYIEALGNYYKLQSEITVTTLDASHNRITELGPTSVPNSIELFFVNNNLIRNVYPNTFIDKINLTRVDLYTNALAKLHLHSIRIAPMRLKKSTPEFYLGANPFECDCSMGWLRHRSGGGDVQSQHHPKIMDYDSIECLVAHKHDQPVRLLSTLVHQDFLCRYETQCPATCHCCEFKSCHCMIKCPDMCSCFHDQTGAIMKINCGKQNAATLPERIPMESSHLYVDGNNYLELKNYAFSSLKKMKSLYLNNSNVITLQNHALTGLGALQKLHLENNKLTVLYGYEFNQLYSLRELYLHDNMLTYVENSTFAALTYLQILRLDGNRLSQLSNWQMQSAQLRGIKSLTLANNMWSCGCEFLQEFIPFVYANEVVVVGDASELRCTDTADTWRQISVNMTIGLCANAMSSDTSNIVASLPEGIPHGYVPLLGFALTIILVLAILVAVFTVKEQMCCVYQKSEMDKPNAKLLYDALILTALEDSEFVAHTIVADLKQTKPTLRFGVQHRSVTTPNVMAIANRSRKIIIYVSNAFLQNEWQRPEVRSTIANSWIPGKIILIQTPNLHLQSNSDRELINNVGRGIVLLKTWEIDFSLKLSYAIDTHPSHYVDDLQQIWKSQNSQMIRPYAYGGEYVDHDLKNDSYYSSATAESMLSHSPTLQAPALITEMTGHVYAGIDSDYGSVTNEDSIVSVHRPIFKSPSDGVLPPQNEVDSTSSMLGSDRETNGYFV